jgi:NADPH2:quinone reductase
MRAVLCTHWGGPEALQVAERPSPSLLAGGVRVAVQAAGVNFADRLMIAGKYQENPPLPFTPGFEVAGTVVEIAPGVASFRPGDRVMGMVAHGGYADEAVIAVDQLFAMPPALDFDAAAGFPVAYGTAYAALAWRARLRPGETLVVFGAAGGVGLAAVEIGRTLGATVIAVAGGAERLSAACLAGAAHGIDGHSQEVTERINALTRGRGADVILDPVGGETFASAQRCIASEGRLVVVGFASGQVGQFSAGVALGKNIDLIGCYWGAYRRPEDAARVRRAYEELGRWVESGKLTPRIAARLPLAEAGRALDLLAARSLAGKIVLTTCGKG